MAVITAGHVAAIVMGLLARGPQRDEEAPAPIAVALLAEQREEAPAPPLRPPEIVMPHVEVPPLDIIIPVDVPSPPITVVARSEPAAPSPSPPPAAPAPVIDASEPVMATSVEYVRPPVLVYPAAAKQARATGTVRVRAVVETDGRVREVRVDRSSGHPSLDKAATEAMRGALFKPYMHNGIARAAVVIVPMDFGLKTRGAKADKEPGAERCLRDRQRDRDADPCVPGRAASLQVLTHANPD